MFSKPVSQFSKRFVEQIQHTALRKVHCSKTCMDTTRYTEGIQESENNQDGVVSKEDLSNAFSNLLGYKGNEDYMGMLLGSLDVAKKGFVDHDSLVTYVERMKLPKAEEIKIQISRAGRDKNKLSKGDLRAILGWGIPDWPYYDPKEDSIEELLEDGIKIFDSDEDGLLSPDEFVELYSCFLFVASIVTPEP